MADSHPYISGPGNITKMISQLRRNNIGHPPIDIDLIDCF